MWKGPVCKKLNSNVEGKQLYEKILVYKMLVLSRAT